MTWTLHAFLAALRRLFDKEASQLSGQGPQPEDPYAYAGVRNRPRRPSQSGAVAVDLEP